SCWQVQFLLEKAGLVQRCVIIQRDENGFGLTVSGDNPVFVQLVKEDGAAMRAGVQTGDRIIKVNGTLVTHSNHIEVVKLIKSGSYVALTVLGRPPGLPQIPLEEDEEERGKVKLPSSLSVPHSPALPRGEQCRLQENIASPQPDGVRSRKQAKEEEYDRNPRPKLLKEIQESKKHISQLQEQLSKAAAVLQVHGNKGTTLTLFYSTTTSLFFANIKVNLYVFVYVCISVFNCEYASQDLSAHCTVGSRPYLLNTEIIGAEDDYFDSQQEQINGECSCFQSIDLLKSRPAHLSVFLHHVVSQFDPAPLLCYLYAEMHKQISSKEGRRFFMEFHSLFLDRTAKSLAYPLPEDNTLSLHDVRWACVYFYVCRQKRSMGLTLADDELSKLDIEQGKDQQALEKECSCAEHILSKIEDILLTSQPSEEEKCQMMQYVILTYMKHLGVKVKEPRGLEHKRVRINFLPKIKSEKEGEEKVKKPRFPIILVPPRRLSRVDSTSGEDKTTVKLSFNYYSLFISTFKICALMTFTGRINRREYDNKLVSYYVSLSLSSRMEVQCSADIQSEDDLGGEVECEEDPLTWQSLVSRGVLASLTPQAIKRQEVINELFYTERAHLRMLKALDCVFNQRLSRDSILPPEDIRHIFVNLEEIIQLHGNQMMAIRKRNETSVIGQIGDDLLSWFSGEEEEKIKIRVGTFCSNQPSALELIKTRQKKDQRFNLFLQKAETNRLCRRLQLKDIIPVEMQRVTKYPLLLDNIAKYTEDGEERQKVKKAAECCKKILNHVNQAVKEAENKQRLEEYQRRLDLSSLKQSENPMILELKNLDLTKRKMIHEGPLSWKVNKDKMIELYTILLEDILVLLQKQDERLILRFHGKSLVSATDAKNTFSPVIKLNTVLVRPVATDKKSFFVLSMSENGAQIYELTAQTVSDRRFINSFDGMKSEDEEEEPPVAEKQEEEVEEEEVDEAELEAFLDGQLAERHPFLQQEGSRRGIAIDSQEHNSFSIPASKAEDALQTCKFQVKGSVHTKSKKTSF
uniref:Rho guanine nucleotide exchange factor (GEF) 12a n=1 Tax=Anabas testudineus TaxID=64144 RepID=A0A7N6AQY8_ANATE